MTEVDWLLRIYNIRHFSLSYSQTKKFADVIIPRGADNTGVYWKEKPFIDFKIARKNKPNNHF